MMQVVTSLLISMVICWPIIMICRAAGKADREAEKRKLPRKRLKTTGSSSVTEWQKIAPEIDLEAERENIPASSWF